eukprot:3465410-Amphidinium_carterae.2
MCVEVSFNAAIASCQRSGQWGVALSTLDTMKFLAVQPDAVSFTGVCMCDGKAMLLGEVPIEELVDAT